MAVYPATSLTQSRAFMNAGQAADKKSATFSAIRGEGSMETAEAIDGLGDDLAGFLAATAVTPDFDAKARPVVHRRLCALPEEVLADPDFWRYLSAVHFHELVSKRHKKNKKSAVIDGVDGNWANFGALRSSVTESLFYRLYTGADLAYDSSASNPYHLALLHDVDLWQSHIVRVMSGDNPRYVRALLTWYRNRAEWYADLPKAQGKAISKYNDEFEKRHLRDLVKRIRRLRSNIVHEYLSDAEMVNLVSDEALKSLLDVGRWGRQKA